MKEFFKVKSEESKLPAIQGVTFKFSNSFNYKEVKPKSHNKT